MLKRSRFNYWSCSKFANWIRGEKKPYALEFDEWDNFHDKIKKKHPWRYWIAEKLLNRLQDIVCFPGDVWWTIDCWYRNRFINQTHCLPSRLEKGDWYDMDYRIIHCLFDSFCYEFCEGELSGRNGKNSKKGKEGFYEYVAWAENSVNEEHPCPDHQIESARKFKELYDWWTIHRPARKDPLEFYDNTGETNPISDYLTKKQRYKKADELEKEYDEEDTERMIELIKLRGSMWT